MACLNGTIPVAKYQSDTYKYSKSKMSSKGRYLKWKWLVKARRIDSSLPQSKATRASWGRKHPLFGSRNGPEILRITVSQSSKPPVVKKRKLRKINFPARYWVALNEQNSVLPPKKEFGLEIKLQDGSSHREQQLEKRNGGSARSNSPSDDGEAVFQES